jgi:hypothetical protein
MRRVASFQFCETSVRALRGGAPAALALALAACSSFGDQAEQKRVDPNLFPSGYKTEILTYLRANPGNYENTRETYLSTPVLKPFGTESRYVACLRVIGRDWRKEKMLIYFGGELNQIVDATSEMCGGAAYQPDPELTAMLSQFGTKR